MASNLRNYSAARERLISFLQAQGFRAHPEEVFCPNRDHCWVDVAAFREGDYWAFEYKSRNDSIRRGLEQCCSYATAFNYVVLVANRHRVTTSPYFGQLRARGFGVWRHDGSGFQIILNPKRRAVLRRSRAIVERQFKRLVRSRYAAEVPLSSWMDFGTAGRSLERQMP